MTTEPLPGPPTAPPAGGSRRAVTILAIVGAVLVLVVVALVFLLIGRGIGDADPVAGSSPTSSAPSVLSSDSASPTPTAAESQAPPVDTSTRFTSFTADLTVECDPTGEQDKPEITFSWTAVNATEAWYTPSDDDAKNDNYMRFPNASAGSQNDLTDEHLFPCNHDQFLDVTITLVAADGRHVSEHVVYQDMNWQG